MRVVTTCPEEVKFPSSGQLRRYVEPQKMQGIVSTPLSSPPKALLYKKFSSASDVYSYGIVMFEVWSLGLKPLSEVPIQQARFATFFCCLKRTFFGIYFICPAETSGCGQNIQRLLPSSAPRDTQGNLPPHGSVLVCNNNNKLSLYTCVLYPQDTSFNTKN